MPFKKGNQEWKKATRELKHGLCNTRLYRCWCDMKQRCNNPKNEFYHRYGGRGITYCREWEEFKPFYTWANANGYSDNLTLDRIDNDGDYTPNNCKWSTQHEQSLNKSHLPNKTGFVGVRKRGRGFVAEVCWRQTYYYVGMFDTPEQAAEAREKFKRCLK